MSALRRALVALGVVGAALVALGAALVASSDHLEHRGVQAVLGATLTASYIGVGLFAWWQRPHNRFGALMTAVGFASFLAALTTANSSLPFTIGMVFGSLYIVIAAHMILAFPTGRLETRGQRLLVAAIYADGILSPLAFALFSPDCGCP